VISPRRFLPDYPVSLEAVVLKALAKNANDRYATASEMQRALDQCFPVAERVNTDEDVGIFLGRLFGKKRDESRAALAEALTLADKQGPRPAGDPVHPFTQSHVSEVGSSPSALVADSTYTSVGLPDAAVRARRSRVVWLSIGGALLALGLTALALHKSDSAVVTPQPATSQEGTTAKPSQPAASNAPSVDLQALPVESAAVEAAPATATTAPRATGFQKPLPATGASARPGKAPAPKWRQDPGF
jgi:hypothetical protein